MSGIFEARDTMTKGQLKRAGEVFEADLAHDLEDVEFARIYALEFAKINAIANILDAIEAARQEKHLPKAEIGRRIDRKPSAVSRLLAGPSRTQPGTRSSISLTPSTSNSR